MGAGKGNTRTIAIKLLKKYAIVLVLILMIVILSLMAPNFFKWGNFKNVLVQISAKTIMAFGVTFVILTAGIDLGLGTYVALTSVVSASIVKSGQPVALALLAGLGVGLLVGVLNGTIIWVFRIPPFIVTLGMSQIVRGAAFLITNGKPVSMLGDAFNFYGKGDVLGIPMPIIILAFMFVICTILLNNMKFGKYAKAIGGNVTAAKISGINTGFNTLLIYVFCGLCCAVAGIVLTGRVDSGNPQMGEKYTLDAIAASVIGGTSLMGGIGTIWGALVGSLIMGALNTALVQMNVSAYWQDICIGTIVIAAIILDEWKNRIKA